MLKTKCIKADPSPDDGVRISVMSCHTLSDGKTLDPGITSDSFDEWHTQLAPPRKLVRSYYQEEITWEEYECCYLNFLQTRTDQILELISRAKVNTVTLLCVEATPDKCHRRLIAEECLRLDPDLQVEIK